MAGMLKLILRTLRDRDPSRVRRGGALDSLDAKPAPVEQYRPFKDMIEQLKERQAALKQQQPADAAGHSAATGTASDLLQGTSQRAESALAPGVIEVPSGLSTGSHFEASLGTAPPAPVSILPEQPRVSSRLTPVPVAVAADALVDLAQQVAALERQAASCTALIADASTSGSAGGRTLAAAELWAAKRLAASIRDEARALEVQLASERLPGAQESAFVDARARLRTLLDQLERQLR